jgi:hypothetical protein
MDILHFDHMRISEIESGDTPMTPDERAFLIRDTPNFEECDKNREELSMLDDIGLMRAAYGVWSDYASTQ